MRYLYLDDLRTPLDPKWDIVRNYDEFRTYLVKYFTFNGEISPEPVSVQLSISFDHDLSDIHYVPKELWNDYHGSVVYQDSQQYTEKTGLHCAKLLAEFNLIPEQFNCHSHNPVGQANIAGFLDGWARWNNLSERRCKYEYPTFKADTPIYNHG